MLNIISRKNVKDCGSICMILISIMCYKLQVHARVVSRRTHTAGVYIFLGFLNIMGMIGAIIISAAVIRSRKEMIQNIKETGFIENVINAVGWLLGVETAEDGIVTGIGAAALILGT